MSTTYRPLAAITHDAIQILSRELGVVETARFLQQYGVGRGNYTEDRRAYLDDLSVEEIYEGIQNAKKGKLASSE